MGLVASFNSLVTVYHSGIKIANLLLIQDTYSYILT
jgi:hypothetical protein